MKILVTGGTGQLGRRLVPKLVGHEVRVLTRQKRPDVGAGTQVIRGDLISGAGVAEAVDGVDVIAHLASDTSQAGTVSAARGRRTEVEPTRRLLAAAAERGRPHVVYISIVGIDKIPLPYYKTKLATEAVVMESALPYTIFRTTQWHTLALDFCERFTKLPVVVAPKDVRMQLLDAGEVADRMVQLLETRPGGFAPEMGGPEALETADIIRTYLEAMGSKRSVRSAALPGKTMKAMREGHNLSPDHADGKITWPQWLASRAT